jgi:2-dehydro-3-deoxygluconokinase
MVAGAESNVAMEVASLGLRSGWLGRVGDDPFGMAILDELTAAGVDTSQALVDPDHPTGLMFKGREEREQAEVVYRRSDSAGSKLAPADIDEDYVASARAVHVSGITTALSPDCAAVTERVLALGRAHGALTSFDLNIRQALWTSDPSETLRKITAGADICFASKAEAAIVGGSEDPLEAAAALAKLGPTTVIVKLGREGAVGISDGEPFSVPARAVESVDAVGAGDAFAAGFLAARLRGWSLRSALSLAAWCGAEVTTTRSDTIALPTLSELQSELAEVRP